MPHREAFVLCINGHFFRGLHCYLDGATSRTSEAVCKAVDGLLIEGRPLDVQALRDRGLTDDDLSRVLVIEFPDSRVAPHAFVLQTGVRCPNCGASLRSPDETCDER